MEIKTIEQLYQETIAMAKEDQAVFKGFQEELAKIKLLYQNCQQAFKKQVVTQSLDPDYIDTELYEYLTTYRESKAVWNKTWYPQFEVFIKENKPFTLEFLEGILEFLKKIKGEAQTFRDKYKEFKDDLSPSVGKSAITWDSNVKEDIENSNSGWTSLITSLTAKKQKIEQDNQLLKDIESRIALHKKLVKIWREKTIPNCDALLVIQDDLKNTKDLYDNMLDLKLLLSKAPANFKKIIDEWKPIAESDEWKRHWDAVNKCFKESEERRNNSPLVNGNPELITGKDQRYIEPNKKIQLYKQKKKDEHKIDANDVKQGDLEDCFVLSPIAALAKTNPSLLESIIEEKSDGSFVVTLHVRKDPKSLDRTVEKVKVKREFVINKNGKDVFAGKGDRELWVQVLEKAIATVRGGYDGLDGGSAEEALQLLTGKKVNKADFGMSDINLLCGDIQKAYQDKKACNFSSAAKPSNARSDYYTTSDNQNIYYEHNYYLDKIDDKNIWLNNPHGKEHLVLKKEDLDKHFRRYYILD